MPRADDKAVTRLPRGGGVTAWRQIADAIASDIASGLLERGGRVPTEAVLASRFGVNRHTVRRALAALAEQGAVRASRGSGTFVEEGPLAYPIGSRTRFSEIVSAGGREPGGRLIRSGEEPASRSTALALTLTPGDPVLRLETLRSANNAPISWAASWLPLPRFSGFADLLGDGLTLSAGFARYGVADYRRVTTRISARPASPEDAARLELAAGRVVLVVDSVNVDATGAPIQATTATFAADRVEIVVET